MVLSSSADPGRHLPAAQSRCRRVLPDTDAVGRLVAAALEDLNVPRTRIPARHRRALVVALAAPLALTGPGAGAPASAASVDVGAAVLVPAAELSGRVTQARHADALGDVVRTGRRLTRARGNGDRVAAYSALADWSTARLRGHERRLQRRLQVERRADRVPPGVSPALTAIAACESGGDPTAVDASGTYRGLFQFDASTWASVGGTGDPAATPAAEQYARAATLYARAGASPWPVCGR